MSLISTVEDDLRNAGVEIGDDVHNVLSRHLGLANIAAHVAEGLQAYQADPLVQLAEDAIGLSPALKAVASGMLGKLVTDLRAIPGVTATEAPAAPAEPAPAHLMATILPPVTASEREALWDAATDAGNPCTEREREQMMNALLHSDLMYIFGYLPAEGGT